ncbi:hypothetical protein NLX83_13035 [Allokutzneria sp. A3M-2-11 16]|uniref:hypothetical protein n=1 Tax=Allokutzneria sp. A3M-2-11 16 TaxID=2962043 RepID=UPI0020B8B4A9|nr:hypothetical protein [Allokutzneria sp. A3M-2-11 16]MCP3800184.1 hypothetical protein [Allokutzneria sp. A3M-2-11 16]
MTTLGVLPELDGADWVAALPDGGLASIGRGLLDLVRGVCGADFDGLSPRRLVIDLRMRRPLCTGSPVELRARQVDGPVWEVRAVRDGEVVCTGLVEVEISCAPRENRVLGIDEVLDAALRFAVTLGDLQCPPEGPPLLGMRAELHRGLPGRRPLTLTCVPESGRVGREVGIADQFGADVGRVRFDWFAASRCHRRNATRVA